MEVFGKSLTFVDQTDASFQAWIAPGAPADILTIYGALGGVTIYAGPYTCPVAGGVTLPTRIDWQLLHGTGMCRQSALAGDSASQTALWESVPLAAASTFLVATPQREGVLWHAGVAGAGAWLLRAGTIHATRLRITLVVRPWGGGGGCCAARLPETSVGSALG